MEHKFDMPIIAPSLLSANLLNLERDIVTLERAGANWLHIDVMDGHYVPNLAFSPQLVTQIKKITGLPLNVHLMVNCEGLMLKEFIKAGADHIIFHPEASDHSAHYLQLIKDQGLKAGLALNPETPLETLYPILYLMDIVLVMTVNPGFGGQKLLKSSLSKVRNLRQFIDERNLPITIEVDGGINEITAPEVIKAGSDVLVLGHYLFNDNLNSNEDLFSNRIKKLCVECL